ncbi:MAG: hypothetical protein M1839_004360 [Geoglossum umbratile]|nr:MAG: hypothetical protein M1839_004360 [Geoglossum umbratile]
MSGYVAPMDLLCPFNPETDLIHSKPDAVMGWSDIGLDQQGVSPVAFAGPCPMFSEDTVNKMELELLSEQVMENCKHGSDPMSFTLRGACPAYAKFSNEVWTHPGTLAVTSQLAQLDLVPVMDYEISHMNVHLGGRKDGSFTIEPHKDSYPFVAILTVSNTSMTGGELELRSGTGKAIKTSRMSRGSVMLLQGRWIEHFVAPCAGRRITAVTSLRPASPFLRDDTRLTTVRHASDLHRLYRQYFEYREIIAIERLQRAIQEMPVWNPEDLLEFVEGLMALYQQTREELVGEVEFDIGSVPRQSKCLQASQSTKPNSLISSSPGVVSELESMVGISREKIGELHGCDTEGLTDFIARREEWLKRIRASSKRRGERVLASNFICI